MRLNDPAPNANDWLGGATSGIADLTGDATADFLVTELGDDFASPDAGSILVFSGADGSFVRRITDPSPRYNGQLGQAVTSISDLTGDGTMEIVVSAAFSDRAGFNGQGEVVLLDGATGALIGA